MNTLQLIVGIIVLGTYLFCFGFRACWFWYAACFVGLIVSPMWSADWWQNVLFAVGVALFDASDDS